MTDLRLDGSAVIFRSVWANLAVATGFGLKCLALITVAWAICDPVSSCGLGATLALIACLTFTGMRCRRLSIVVSGWSLQITDLLSSATVELDEIISIERKPCWRFWWQLVELGSDAVSISTRSGQWLQAEATSAIRNDNVDAIVASLRRLIQDKQETNDPKLLP